MVLGKRTSFQMTTTLRLAACLASQYAGWPLSYEDYFGNKPATGYETLIYDCMKGDATLYKHADTVEKGWEIVQSVLDVWAALPPRDFPNYAAGSVLVSIPVVVLFLLLNRFLVSGLTLGGVKG